MTERACTYAAITVGAAVGAIVGYVLLTDAGRAWRRGLEPAIDDLSEELNRLRSTVQKAAGVANEGWKLLNEALDTTRREPPRYGDPHQTTPF